MFSVEQLVANRIWFDLRSRVVLANPDKPDGRIKRPLTYWIRASDQYLVSRWQVKRGRDISLAEASKAIASIPVHLVLCELGAYTFHWDFNSKDRDLLRSIIGENARLVRGDSLELVSRPVRGVPVAVSWLQICRLSRWYVEEPLRPRKDSHLTLAYALHQYMNVLCTPHRLRETESWGEELV